MRELAYRAIRRSGEVPVSGRAALAKLPLLRKSDLPTLQELGSLALRAVRALLPVATLYVGKLIIDEAVRLVERVCRRLDRPAILTIIAFVPPAVQHRQIQHAIDASFHP